MERLTEYVGDRYIAKQERARLQTIPDWYNFGNLSKTKITDLIGDGWNIETIKHILSYAKLST
jgi:site-specific DNA-cytosine methylase